MFGLSASEFKILLTIIAKQGERLERVVLFGSRARGDYKATSDIDLAIQYKKNIQSCSSLQYDFESSALPFTVDIVDLMFEKETKIKKFIRDEGIILYDCHAENIGDHWMTVAILNEKLADFQQALTRLDEALEKNIEKDSLYLDGTIQRFEFTYELCWKLMKAYLNHVGIDVNNPRAAIRESFKQNLIHDSSDWFLMIDKRNLTTHTYHKDIALDVYAAIQSKFVKLMHQFNEIIAPLITDNG